MPTSPFKAKVGRRRRWMCPEHLCPIKEFDELALLIRAHHPLICINAQEPERVEVLLEYLCGCFGLPYFEWTPSSGLRREGQPGAVYGTQGLLAALAHVHASKLVAIYHFNLSGESLDDGRAISKLLELAEELGKHPGAIVISFVESLPPELSHAFAEVELSPPTREEYYQYLRAILADVRTRQNVALRLSKEQIRQLLSHLQGLTLMEVRRLLTASLVEHQALDERRHRTHCGGEGQERRAKQRAGVLPRRIWLRGACRHGQLEGLAREARRLVSRPRNRAKEFGLTPPRGVLLLGVQGCGKSHTAQAVAAELEFADAAARCRAPV